MRLNSVTLLVMLFAWFMNSEAMMQAMDMVIMTPYSNIAVSDMSEDEKLLRVNNSFSSKFSADPAKRFPYIKYIEKNFINTMPADKKYDILVLGAGGFVVGWDDKINNYTFVDIDPAIKKVAEDYFLPKELSPNKHFEATSARAFLGRTHNKYDLIIVDVYSNVVSIPAEAITAEFLQDVKKVMRPEAVLVANIISSPSFDDRFSVRYYNSFASVFPVFDRQVVGDMDPWKKGSKQVLNTLYVYYNKTGVNEDRSRYTDNKNSYSLDH